MDGQAGGKPVPQALIDRGVVPFLKIDKGLETEADGVQLMKPMPGLDELLARAKGLGVFGTKERSVVNLANQAGIAAVVRQQFEIGAQVLAAGLMPILEPEVNIKSPERAAADGFLLDEILAALDEMPGDDKVMLKLSLPATPGTFYPLVHHPRVCCAWSRCRAATSGPRHASSWRRIRASLPASAARCCRTCATR